MLRAAAQAIAELGLANVRVADVAARAGMEPGHVTYYFSSKDALLMRAFRWSEEGLHAAVHDEIHRIDDPWKRLRRLFSLGAARGPGDPGWVLWFEVWARAGTDPSLAEGIAELEAWWRAALADVIRYGVDEGAFATDDIDAAVFTLSAVVDGLSIQTTLGAISRRRALSLCMSAAHRYLG